MSARGSTLDVRFDGKCRSLRAESVKNGFKTYIYGNAYVCCRYGDIREVLIFARRTNSRIEKSRENYYYYSAILK